MSLDKTYDPHAIESRWYAFWEEQGFFSPSGDGAPYCIMIPPPNVTGSLHMGHAFQDTIMDALIRFHRMKGRKTLWQPGTDHAGIATQMVVERLVNKEGKTRHDYGREKFIEKIWEWKEESGGTITRQLRRMGASPDWRHERFTMDEGLTQAVIRVFVELYDEGIIYRGKRLVNWDPVLHTALSDLEVLSAEEQGSLWHLKYPLVDSPDCLTVATTRPETMLGDSAVAVHPEDARYRHLVGRYCELPLTGRQIPVIADDYVDPEFGSGCVKITPAHDFNDYQVWLRHRDEEAMRSQPDAGLINIFTVDARIRGNVDADGIPEGAPVPDAYVGKDRFEARAAIVDDLKERGLLDRTQDHSLMIPRGDRSGAVVEPFLTDQWFVDLTRSEQPDGRPGGRKRITEPSIEAVRSGAIGFVPENWSRTYFQWLENIEDWCISRQLWWGHRIPAWYDDEGHLYVGLDENHVREKYSIPDHVGLTQDEDVLDTWFSSALWPFSTLGWPQRNERLDTFYPTSVLVTGFDIIFFWVARMVMMGTCFMGDVPFHQVYIHGLIRDAHGQKMSKSKGNVLDPIDLIDGIDLASLVEKRTSGMMQPHLAEKIARQTREDYPDGIPSFGTDALRFTFAALASTGRDINFDLARTAGYRNFCNKIWNAARFVLINTENRDCGKDGTHELMVADRWIISRLERSIETVQKAVHAYRFDMAAKEIHDLVWNRYCDWYLEFCKATLNAEELGEPAKAGCRWTMVRVLETILRLAHPIMPFITEEIWQRIAPLAGAGGETIMTRSYPEHDASRVDAEAEQEMKWVMELILGVRRIRGEMDISPGKRVPLLLSGADGADREMMERNRRYLDTVGRLLSMDVLDPEENEPESSVTIVDSMRLLIPLEGLIDRQAERTRLKKELDRIDKEILRIGHKLDNPNFLNKAPAAVVEKEREKLSACQREKQELSLQMTKLD
ncbi:MAG: valine--tRNA ligase [Gammaproteobacteria bacterium]|nr:valine--tRNA ligase [Gammaproteobacteria bacterium]MYD76472.1 valine--tRNA ligase [Gammaproteobacteria bacterium]